jgi:hypothetical protein
MTHSDASADAQLASMGYKAELPRNLSMMSILGLFVSAPVTKERYVTDIHFQEFRNYGYVHPVGFSG